VLNQSGLTNDKEALEQHKLKSAAFIPKLTAFRHKKIIRIRRGTGWRLARIQQTSQKSSKVPFKGN